MSYLVSRALGTGCLIALLAPAAGFAHAGVESTSPHDGGNPARVKSVSVRFGEPVLSGKISVFRAGKRVHANHSGLAPRNAARLRATFSKRLGSGNYTVRWSVVADDGDPQQGSFHFRVR